MNGAQAHLLFNHLPVFGIAFGILILLFGVFRRSDEMKRVALGLFVITALGTIPAYLTGEPAEDVVEEMAGVSESMIEEHEESATGSLIAIEVLGILSLLGLFVSRQPGTSAPALLVKSSIVLSLLALGLVAWTAHLGGQVHHPEIRAGFQLQLPEGEGGNEAGRAEERSNRREREERQEDDSD